MLAEAALLSALVAVAGLGLAAMEAVAVLESLRLLAWLDLLLEFVVMRDGVEV